MTAQTAKPDVAFDKQGDKSDQQRVINAMKAFVSEFGLTSAVHMDACVNCGMCAKACQFHVRTKDPKYTPINKLKPFKQAYFRHASPFSVIFRYLNLTPQVKIEQLEEWQELIFDSCNMCGRCTLVCPMGIDIAELVKEARHGMFAAGLVPERLALIDRTARAWGSPATPAEDFAEIIEEIADDYEETINVDLDKADILVTVAAAELNEGQKAIADAAKILNRSGYSWTFRTDGFEATNIGFLDGDIKLQEKLTRSLIDAAVKVGAKYLVLPECGHAYGAARWEAARWYGEELPVTVLHMTELLDMLIADGRIKVNKVDTSVSFHDPCQLVRRGGVVAAPRRILKALGVELKELKDHGSFSWCCGGGGGVVSNQRANPLRYKAFEIKRGQVEEAGADRFVTACGQCLITLNLGAKHFNWNKQAESLMELVADNLAE